MIEADFDELLDEADRGESVVLTSISSAPVVAHEVGCSQVWTWRWYLSLEDLEAIEHDAAAQGSHASRLCLSDPHSRNLRMLERRASQIQYLLACLSTLGGAHHLCHKPREALQLAIRQEFVGRVLGSTQVVVRAQVFQAVNYALLGDVRLSRHFFRHILKIARAADESSNGGFALHSFVKASLRWVSMELNERKADAAEQA